MEVIAREPGPRRESGVDTLGRRGAGGHGITIPTITALRGWITEVLALGA